MEGHNKNVHSEVMALKTSVICDYCSTVKRNSAELEEHKPIHKVYSLTVQQWCSYFNDCFNIITKLFQDKVIHLSTTDVDKIKETKKLASNKQKRT